MKPCSRRTAKTASQLHRLRKQSIEEIQSLFQARVELEPETPGRDRLFPQVWTFWLFLSQVLWGNVSCSETVQNALAWLCRRTGQTASPNTAAYCKARSRLEEKTIKRMCEKVAADLESRYPKEELIQGRRVRIVDGSSLSMPDTPESQKRFPQPKKQKPGCGFPVMRVVVLFSMATGAILRVAWGSLHVHERILFHRIWNELKAGDILVADRGFCGFADFYLLLRRGVDCIMRNHQRRTKGVRFLKKLGKDDLLVAWRKTAMCPKWLRREIWKTLPAEMTVRQIRILVDVPGFRTKEIVLATTLLDRKLYPKALFAELYRRRWLAELFLRDIKTSMDMEVLKCKSPEMIVKEVLMYLIAYNLIRSIMLEAAQRYGGEPLRISFKRTADALRQWMPVIRGAHGAARKRLINTLLYYIARLTVPYRPDRTEPRAIKRRKKNYQLLNKPREEFREISHRNHYKAGLS
jgi:hypothetical protein